MKFKAATRYRIYTENVDSLAVSKIQIIVNWHFPSCTIIHTDGVFNQKKEKSLIIEIITEKTSIKESRIERICHEINRIHSQECCMVTREVISGATV
jgi:predicted RNA-binding protein with PIN domain